MLARISPYREMARTVGANRQQSKAMQHPPKRTTPEWSHAAVACMADIQPSALGTGCHPGSETSVGLPGQQKLYVRRSHMRPEPHHDKLHTFRRETGVEFLAECIYGEKNEVKISEIMYATLPSLDLSMLIFFI